MRPLNKKIVNPSILITFIGYLYILLFLYAASSKLLDFETFTVQLAQSPLLSAYAGTVAWLVPGVEIVIAFLLVFERFRILALYAAFTLMVMFTAYIYIILNFSDFIPCSCGGVLEKLSWTQHLFFNVFFIILAGVAIFFADRYSAKKTLLLLVTLAIFGIGTVTFLFAFSEKKMHRNNAFQRRYIPHPIEKLYSFDLKYGSYYFAGNGNDSLYLGNTTAPLLLLTLDNKLKDTTSTIIRLDQMDLPYRSVRISVLPPYFYVTDGTVPIILQGNSGEWKATTKMHGSYYFNHILPINSKKMAVISSDSKNGESMVGTITFSDTIEGVFNSDLLEKQFDGVFDTDGKLIYNYHLNKIIYTYYYRNQYIGANENLKLEFRGRTIDTVSIAQLDIGVNRSKGQRKLGKKSILVNRSMATYNNFLFIDSPRLGKLEPADMLDNSNIIDVYDLVNQKYKFSFYLFAHKNKKARELKISDGTLYALHGNEIVAYKMDKIFF